MEERQTVSQTARQTDRQTNGQRRWIVKGGRS